MPEYSFRCTTCEEVFSQERPLGYLDDEQCPLCGSKAKRVFEVFEKPPEIGGGACSSHKNTDGILANMNNWGI